MIRKFISVILAVLSIFMLFSFTANAEAEYKNTNTTVNGFASKANLFDAKRTTYTKAGSDASVTLSRDDGVSHIYIEFDRTPSVWSIKDNSSGKTMDCGKYAFLHEYVDVEQLFGYAPKSVTMSFPEGTVIADIYGFSAGELPEFVQIWNPPCEKADMMIITTHSDDEQLFFAGTLPYYAIERKLQVQIVYAVQHFEAYGVQEHRRPHEQIDGLWTVGIRNYPVISDIPDIYAESKDRDTAYKQAIANFGAVGVTYDDFKSYITECLRRFKPQVVVSHDLNGEYGHGAHILVSTALTEVIKLSSNENEYKESADKYGTWSPLKTYLHLYGENKITLDWDTPLDSMGGKTPFQVSQAGFNCHKSQHWTWFYGWMYGKDGETVTKASQITKYSPCEFGLYDSKVGADTVGGDFMENITSYAKQKEEAEALEAQKKAEEEAKKKEEEERKAQEEAQKQAEEEEAKRKQEESALQEEHEEENKNAYVWIVIIASVAIFGIIILGLLQSSKQNKKKQKKRLIP